MNPTDRTSPEEARLRAILDATPDAIFTIRPDGSVVSVNAAAERIFGFRATELLGNNISMIMASPHRERHDSYLARYLASGQSAVLGRPREVEGQRKDGSHLPLQLWVAEVHQGDERLFLGIVRDITATKAVDAARQRLLDALNQTAIRIARASGEILAGTAEQASGAQEQAAAVAQTAATVDEVQKTFENAADRARQVAHASERSVQIGVSGRRAVEQTIGAMEAVRDQVEDIAEHVVALSEQAQAIGEIIAAVTHIADQTNLLALNAAIEAARAGEHGRGFAVVATEIRALADQSKRATTQVRQSLGEIQRATQAAVEASQEGTQSVELATQVVGGAGDTIKALGEILADANQAAAQIATSAGQQSTGMTQIHLAMRNINQVTAQNLPSTRQAERAAQDLNVLAHQLRELLQSIDRG